jgi:hypothetical protein
MKVIKAPSPIGKPKGLCLFLAGSIEQDTAEHWQAKLTKYLEKSDLSESITIFNPRRDDWDSSWVEQKDNKKFNEQVTWELDAMERADLIPMYFDPNTKSPISLLELGLNARSGKLIVYCPRKFWKKGNVDIVAEKYDFPVFENKDVFFEFLLTAIKSIFNIRLGND